MAAEHVTGIVK